jgi:hypothetical protein
VTSAEPPLPAEPAVAGAGNQSTPIALSRDADEELNEVRADDAGALAALLDSPNSSVRAGALRRLKGKARALSEGAVTRTVELLNDNARVTAPHCLGYEANRGVPMGQGMMLSAAECAHSHTTTVSELAKAVLAHAEPKLLGPACVRVLAKDPHVADPLRELVRARGVELSRPLQRALVVAQHKRQIGEADAAVQLLAQVAVGSAEPDAVENLKRLAARPRADYALRATTVLLTLVYEKPPAKPSKWAEQAYDRLRAELRRDPEAPCSLQSGCVPVANVLLELRAMREAAAPLVPELVAILDNPDPWARIGSLLVLKEIGKKAEPALPKLVHLLKRKRELHDEEDVGTLVLVLGALRSKSGAARQALVSTAKRYPSYFEEVAQALAAIGAALPPAERRTLRSVYEEQCADAGSVANFSYSRDERCAKAARDLKQLGLRFD